jgi:hypothetical protein
MKLSCTCLSSSDTALITTNPTGKLVDVVDVVCSIGKAGRFLSSRLGDSTPLMSSYSNAGLAMPWDA